jgi:hypothetical protein
MAESDILAKLQADLEKSAMSDDIDRIERSFNRIKSFLAGQVLRASVTADNQEYESVARRAQVTLGLMKQIFKARPF